MSEKFRKRAGLVLSIALMLLIFWFSSRNGSQSQSQSDALLPWLPAWIPTSIASFVLRKGAHFCIYAALGFCTLLYVREEDMSWKKALLISLALCALYAAFDELHQHFVPGRSGQLDDVLLDACGSFCGILVCAFCFFLCRRLKARDQNS